MNHFKKRRGFISTVLIFTFTLLLMQELLWVTTAHATESPTQLLNNGIEQYNNAEFDLAVEWLQQAIAAGLKTKSEQVAAYKYYAFCLTALGNAEQAKTQFLKALDIDPEFQLDIAESPRLLDVFNEARAAWTPQDRQAPVIDFSAPSAVNEKTPLTLTAKVTDASGLAAVELYYKASAAGSFKAVNMTAWTNSTYIASIPGTEVNTEGLRIYIKATDKAGNPPALAGSDKEPLVIPVNMVDTDSPVIEHTPVTLAQENSKIEIRTTIIDRSGVANATLYYHVKGAEQFKEVELKHRGENLYITDIPDKDVTITGVEYYITATDIAKNKPAFKGSAEQPFAIRVTMQDEQPPLVVHKPVTEAEEKTDIRITATVTDRSGVLNVTLYYQSSGDKTFQTVDMKGQGDEYSAMIPADKVKPDALAYYLEARDKSGNPPAFAGTEDKPLTIKITKLPVTTQPLVAQAEPEKKETLTTEPEKKQKADEPKPAEIKEKKGGFPWLWVGLGAVAVGVAYLLSGDNDSPEKPVADCFSQPPGRPE